MVELELILKPLEGLGIGAGKEAISALVDEPRGWIAPLQNVSDNVTGTIPFALGIINMFTWQSTYGDVALGGGGAIFGEAIAKLVRQYTSGLGRRGRGVTLELESNISPMHNPQGVSQVDSIHGVVV